MSEQERKRRRAERGRAAGRRGRVWLGKRGNEEGHDETDRQRGREGVEHTRAMSHTW